MVTSDGKIKKGKNLDLKVFKTGATRNTDFGKPNYEAALSPLVIKCFGDYMVRHRMQPDGSVRKDDNWQKGMSFDSYMECGYRHFMDWWLEHRGHESRDGLEDALCGLLFNVQGYLHEHLKKELKKKNV